jgi:hypothetical protein
MTHHPEEKLREALARMCERAWNGRGGQAVFSIPARPGIDADLILADAIDELVAAREEAKQRDAAVKEEREPFAANVERTEKLLALSAAELRVGNTERNRLRAFVAAYDAWAVSHEHCCGPAFDAMLEARESIATAIRARKT